MMTSRWEITIKRDGMWPTKWSWMVMCSGGVNGVDCRTGESFTKDRARRAALKAKRSMEEDDVRVVYS